MGEPVAPEVRSSRRPGPRLATALGLLALGVALVTLAPGLEELRGLLATPGVSLEGPALVRSGLALALATFVSEDLTCLLAGGLVAQGSLGFVPAVAACFAGILAGDVLLFLAGRWFGSALLRRAPLRWLLDEARVARAARWLERRGALVILGSRFLPGARLPTYFASGALGTSLPRFVLWFALAGALWTPAVVALAAGLGEGLGLDGDLRRLGGLLALGWVLLLALRTLSTWRGRAFLALRLRRLTRFEYWPRGVYYLPVFVLFLLRALRGRGLEFTAADPCFPHGGFVGESKIAIQAALERADAPLPRTLGLPAGEPARARRAAVRRFRAQGTELPLVLKPDAGQRGEGVRVLRDETALERALAAAEDGLEGRAREGFLLQEFVPGAEFGLFYARPPGAARGRVTSITRKLLPAVRGDGRRTLERLILADRAQRAMAPLFLARHAHELERVPAAGERVLLGELGTHCLGAHFHDAGTLLAAPLEDAVERIARALPGFHLGRFDVRAESDEALARGRFVVLELNGVTSEATHVYDPRHGLVHAWRTLLAQWRLAYALGRANAAAGARVSRLGELLQAVREHRTRLRRRARGAREAEAAA